MKYRMLGSTGFQVSEIGFGAWGIGGSVDEALAYGPTDEQESMDALRRAYDLGVNFYDTAGLYGRGNSERLIGRVFKDVRSNVIIATKVGLLDSDGGEDFSSEGVERSLDASLSRLQTDYVDLLQLHGPSVDRLRRDEEILTVLEKLERSGKVRATGISVRSPDDGLAAVTELGFKCIQVNLNLADQRAWSNGLLDLCSNQNVGVIARTPLCFGFLTGEYSTGHAFGLDDHRAMWSAAQLDRWASAGQLFASTLVNDDVQSPAQIALRFCLSHSGVSTVIPGMLNSKEVDENTAASDMGQLSHADLPKARQLYAEQDFFVGT
jgi:aryl-alcohol dehydrogenase-like predicted oxidoreductase